ncbi:MAG: hypothetical protein PUK66_07080, partial [Bacteroidales bacterium]|uniref:hypothetical protein n=1 Tax=Porphyromonas sp. TaxID=1924944 RepID=UPI002970A65E
MITLYNAQGNKIIDITDLEGSYCDRSIMGSNTLNVVVKSDTPLDLPLGAYIDYEGHRYTLLYPATIKKQHTRAFEYTILLHGEEELLASCILKDISGGVPYRVKFALTAKPADFIRYIVASLNEHYGGGWDVGNVIDATEQTLAFSHEYCLGALSRVAEAFNTEFAIEGKKVSLGKVTIMEENPLPMSYGKGNGFRPGTGRHNDGKKSALGKLYVEGGSRNIDYPSYGAQTLLLPKSATLQQGGRTYRTDAHGMYITCDDAVGTTEGSYDGTAIYPMREGTVTEVIQEEDGYDIIDNTIPATLDYNDYRIKGEKATIIFRTGALTGREFALVQTKDKLTGYIHAERKFKLVSEEQDGYLMPGGNFIPKVGDKYAIYNITLPSEYLSNASQRLFEESVRYFDTVINPPYVFSGEVDPIWAKKEWLHIGGYMQPGAHILFTDPQYHTEGSVVRVMGVRTPLDKPYAPQLTLSNAPAKGVGIGNALSKLEADKVIAERRELRLQRLQRQNYEQALEHIAMVERAVADVEGFTERIKPSVIETMGMVIGSQASQFDFVAGAGSLTPATITLNYNKDNQQLTITRGVLRHQTLGITDLAPSRKASKYRYWSLSEFVSPALSEASESYYIYAKVPVSGNSGVYLLSKMPIAMEDVAGYYYLLIGTLSSTVDGDRVYNRLYGYSMISPGQITLSTINSTSGNMRIDLETGEIFSDVIKFRRPDNGEEVDVADYIDELDTHQPIIKDGTWWRWDGGKYVDTGEPARGDKGQDAQGVRANLMPLDNFRYNSGGLHVAPNSYSNGKLTIAEDNVCKNSLTSIAAFGSRDKQYIDGTTAGKTLIYSYYVRNNTNVPLIIGNHIYNDKSRLAPVQPGQVSRRYMVRTDGYERFIIGESRINGDTATLSGTVEYYDFKVEQAQDGEELVPTAYIPCVIDMQGTSGTSLIYYGTRSFDSTSSYIVVGYGDANWLNNLNLPLSSIKAGDTLYLLVTLTDTGQSGVLYVKVTSVGTTVAGKVVAFIKDGHDGAQGIPGTPGADGRTPYLHIAYATNATGTAGFSTTDSVGKTYIGQYTDYVQADSTTPSKYKWTLIKGEKGDKGDTGPRGLQGIQGVKGDQGIPGAKGADGKTSYTHIAYADTATGGGFSQSPVGKAYIGMYVDFVETDSSEPTKYAWSLIKGADGAQGVPGAKGADGRTPYLHIAYATNATGTTGFSTTDSTGKTYIGTYTDFVQADSTNPSSYKWTLIKGEKGQDAINFDMGRMVHPDPTFMEGFNKIYKYDNANQGAVTVNRIARPADCPTTSSHALEVHYDSTIASVSPGIGGFKQYTQSRANAVFVHRFIANVPAGYKLNWSGDPIGLGGSHKWVTSNVGTGKYEEYICVTRCGSSGTFSNFGHIYLSGARATMDVIIAYATMYDMTDAPDYYAKIAEAKQVTADLKTYTDGAFADGIISKTEAQAIATYKQQVNESWTSAFAEYEKVYANPLLSGTPKTTLLNAKVSLSGAKDQLLSAITSAIADGKATTAEAANVDTKYNAYNSALAAFQKALEDAREAIRKGGHEIIDTRNDNKLPSWYRIHYKKTTVREFKVQTVIGIPEAWRNGSYCTLETTVNYSDKSGGRVTQKAILNNSVELQRVGTADDTAWEPWSNMSAQLSTVDGLIAKLRSGDFKDFPDLKYLTDAFDSGGAQVMGLVFTQLMALTNNVNQITAYLNGNSSENIAVLKAGISTPLGANEKEKVAINHDGSGHLDTLHFGDGILNFISRTGFKSLLRVGEGTMSKSLDEIINSNIVDAYTPATISDRTLRN